AEARKYEAWQPLELAPGVSTPGVSMPGVSTPGVSGEGIRTSGTQPAHVQAFQDRLQAHAEEASRSTGIPSKFMLGQAALESGWGKREILMADGSTSHNLFGIKAGPGWKGKTVEAVTTEYVDGVAQKRAEKFRAYDSYADSFRDYARLLRSNPRYESVLANATDVNGFAQGLQRAGYATDPNYAAKLTRIITQNLST
ncbi:MAG: flagellar assembly peptidoglycan hydrolase FlgJ, partial [Noviherbaspirillum sp.]